MNTPATTTSTAVATAQTFKPFANPADFKVLKEMATYLATSNIVPTSYKDKPGDCMIAINISNRMNIDPLMVMQNLYVVNGKPAWSSSFMIACFNTCGRYTTIEYEDNIGKEKDYTKWQCRAKATDITTGRELVGSWITWTMAEREGWTKKNGSKWLTMPAQMFRYRSAAFFIRSVAPEIALGFHTKDEILDGEIIDQDAIDITAQPEAPNPLKAAMEKAEALANKVEEPAEEGQMLQQKSNPNEDTSANLFDGSQFTAKTK